MAYFLVLYIAFVGIWLFAKKSYIEPWVINREIGWFPLSLSIMAGLVGGNTFVSFTGFSYRYGSPAMAYFVGVFIAFIIFYIFNNRIRGLSSESLGAGLVFNSYPKSTKQIFVITNLVRFFSVSLIQVIAGSQLISEIGDLPYPLCTLIIVISITAYTIRHGLNGVIRTDIIQMTLTIIPMLLISIYILAFSDLRNAEYKFSFVYEEFSWARGILFGLFGFLFVIGSLDIWQRYTRLKTSAHARNSLLITLLSLSICALGIFLISYVLRVGFVETFDANKVFVRIFTEDILPDYIKLPLALAILSAILSSADTFIQGSSLLVIKALKREEEVKKSNKLYILSLVIIGLLLLVISNLYVSILSIVVFFGNLVFAFAPFLLFLIFNMQPNHKMVNLGLIVSGVFGIFVGIWPNTPLEYSYGTLVISLIFMLLGLTKKNLKPSLNRQD